MNEQIFNFIKKNKLLSLCIRDEIGVYTASCFYAFDELNLALIIASNENSKHIKLALKDSNIAINIAKLSKISLLKGIQAKAIFKIANEKQEKIYYKKFPFAKFANDFKLYSLYLQWAKLTDNSLMLTSKLEFNR
ncbi:MULTISPECIES: hypothetical protein [unclassified Campylobacter]|uniref:hypothetical protein n=1 Tax=unclassified Campylobacter TaxID=2593542 RepID=UPI001237DCBC|nr:MULTISPECIES: hypothetical protein [unclassified Campylobacter]KAA6225150.1 hypothetical protein FMM55_07685 [Campylobacter sp. LR196d]KAA6226164.1 hypothetical protein FMM54_05065 [Campylobacter sp. LR185c]KAA6228112.1 hypothetical protein FMM57_03755 [Campylobacter sp. LR286c]KAA6231365.1 hypothetical protein FMM56_04210 [Campylobacter sp. LR264d]KAA6231576.1 hypothetical protein FMM58_03005 [Campylobacter sp. LR291e]